MLQGVLELRPVFAMKIHTNSSLDLHNSSTQNSLAQTLKALKKLLTEMPISMVHIINMYYKYRGPLSYFRKTLVAPSAKLSSDTSISSMTCDTEARRCCTLSLVLGRRDS